MPTARTAGTNSAARMQILVSAVALLLGTSLCAQVPIRQQVVDPATNVMERLGAMVPLDAAFHDEQGRAVTLQQYFDGKRPVILNLGYYGCPALCGAVLNGLLDALKPLELEFGKDFAVVTLSFDPREKPELAREKKAAYLQELARPAAADHWHFLTGEEPQIRAVAQAVGFGYEWDAQTSQYLHGAAIMLLSPQGKTTRYLFGADYRTRDLRFALVEAGEGRVGTTWDRILLSCYGYDPRSKSYQLVAWTVMRIGGGLSAALIAVMIFFFVRRERRLRVLPATT